MQQRKFRNRWVALGGALMLLGGALVYALPAYAGENLNGVRLNGISLNGISWNATTYQGEPSEMMQGESFPFNTLSQRALGKKQPDRIDSNPILSNLNPLWAETVLHR